MGVVLKLESVTKEYPGVLALDKMNLEVHEGEVHALMGENGAGKSTLIKVVSGAIKPNGGKITYLGNDYEFMTPALSKKLGIGVIYQDFNLVPELSVAENIFLGQKLTTGLTINRKLMNQKAKELMENFGIDIDVTAEVKSLTVAYQQLVEIAKTISSDVKVLIMDEPSAPLTNREIEAMFKMIEKLKKQGIAIIYISHRMEEIFRIADRITVMRDGKYVGTKLISETDNADLIKMMVGRNLDEQFPQVEKTIGDVVLKVEHLSTPTLLKDINFEVRSGEILGLAGLVGAGRTETARAIFGADPKSEGTVSIKGKATNIRKPKDAIGEGVALIPEDRKKHGVLLDMSIRDNVSFICIKNISKAGFVNRKKDVELSEKYIKELSIKTPTKEQLAKNLSGGNQQKVVLAKSLASDSDIIIFDEPTRGIDVGAKKEIYVLMNELAAKGMAIIMISSEMPELLGMSDRIVVMHEGEVMGEMDKADATQEKILELASGMK
ncbi:sugar ABC transporter ATP-binding protein [Clostridium sp. C105KSO13]|uniref:sugar ABC transporter ATP-binding protein n=1 Tax=Clostridium sp. C105KSO13 TaxID=1776045 RepID=UPI0007407582|nr:sugar ABC transporter ATP-binding protein [Clostridium sp. C105KSO13]CUX29967.1 Ribose import ATP-binding protein RbsA [Clostridium sp. C105KSO13]